MADDNKATAQNDGGEGGPDFRRDHADTTGAVRPDLWRQAVAAFLQLDRDASVRWEQIGPAPLVVDADPLHMGIGPDSGAVADLCIDPSGAADTTIYLATDNGGIWKTKDAGSNWLAMTDGMPSLTMGAVAMDPANTSLLYAGSGNSFDAGAPFERSAGLYRSVDGGQSWSIVDGGAFGTILGNLAINRIVCPEANVVLVATGNGLYRSVDAGNNFGANAPDYTDRKPLVAGDICCLQLDTANNGAVYAGVAGDSVDAGNNPLPTVGLLMSTDKGKTFPTNLFSNPGAPVLPYGSFAFAQSQLDGATANSAVLYVSVQRTLANGTPGYVGLYRSLNGGGQWTLRPSLAAVAAADGLDQTNYDLTLGVDPLNSTRVYAGFQQLWLSTDGGATFQPTAVSNSKVHWDNHAIAFSPAGHRGAAAPTQFYTGTDGGVASTSDGGLTWKPLNHLIATSLFRGIDIGHGAAGNAYTYGGCQDTGTSGRRPTDAALEWHAGINGDGWQVAADPSDATIVYGFDDGYFIKTTNAGAAWQTTYPNPNNFGVGLTHPSPSDQHAIALEKTGTVTASRTVYVSEGKVLNKSSDAGLHFAATALAPGDYITCI
ncbi:MAG: hypothetical protein WCA37_10640, partial [Terracidiphilus sp.]